MPKASTLKLRRRSEDEILDQATKQLLKATKAQAKKDGAPVNREELRKEGFSERFIDKVENA